MCIYIYIYIYGHPPRSIPASSTRFHRLLLYVGPLLTFAENTVNTDRIVHFRHVHANRVATSRGFDTCINLAPNLARRFMIVYVSAKLK